MGEAEQSYFSHSSQILSESLEERGMLKCVHRIWAEANENSLTSLLKAL